jgi:hypothetical protein
LSIQSCIQNLRKLLVKKDFQKLRGKQGTVESQEVYLDLESKGAAEFEFVVGQAVGEFDRVDVDEPALRALASATGGEYHTMATAARIPDRIQKNIRRRTYPEERTLWNTPGFFLVFLGCVVLEWVLRKRYGLN